MRLDNIYNFYDIVSRTPEGSCLRLTKLDRALVTCARGTRAVICLSYMPETLSQSGVIEWSARQAEEWAALVEATVRHVTSTAHGRALPGSVERADQ